MHSVQIHAHEHNVAMLVLYSCAATYSHVCTCASCDCSILFTHVRTAAVWCLYFVCVCSERCVLCCCTLHVVTFNNNLNSSLSLIPSSTLSSSSVSTQTGQLPSFLALGVIFALFLVICSSTFLSSYTFDCTVCRNCRIEIIYPEVNKMCRWINTESNAW